jgi:multicomponent Na+:H+ antiporter subunit G
MAFDSVWNIVGNIVIIAGMVFMLIGVIGIFKLKDFYPRILVASKVDTVGMFTIIAGFIIRSGITFFSAKLLLIIIIMLILNPLVAHIMVRSAHKCGFEVIDEEEAKEQ